MLLTATMTKPVPTMKKIAESMTLSLRGLALALLVGCVTTGVQAGLLETQNNPVSFGANYWGSAAVWDSMGIPKFTDQAWQQRRTDEKLIEVISKGKGQMPGWKEKLTEEQIKLMVAYIRKFPDQK